MQACVVFNFDARSFCNMLFANLISFKLSPIDFKSKDGYSVLVRSLVNPIT